MLEVNVDAFGLEKAKDFFPLEVREEEKIGDDTNILRAREATWRELP